ncbi:MAG: glycosyltransferase family 2 protein [Candidatus Anstonellales archaeon]
MHNIDKINMDKVKYRTIALIGFILLLSIFWVAIESIGYFWVMLVPNFFLLVLTCVFIVGYLSISNEKERLNKNYEPISIIVPGYNAGKTLKRCIESIKNAYYPTKKEIIYVDDGSTDDSVKIAKNMGIKVIEMGKNQGKAKALNTGIKAAKNEIIACIDSDTYLDKDALINAVKKFNNKDVGAVAVLIKVERPDKLIKKFQDLEYAIGFGLYALIGKYFNIIFVTPGPMTLFKKSVFDKIGLFDENNITEDLEMGWRLRKYHYKIEYALDAVVYTEVPETVKGLLRQRLRWYRGKLVNLKKYHYMLFNPKYGDFGTFMLPFSLTAEFAAITVIMATSIILIKQFFWGLLFLFYSILSNIGIVIESLPILSSSALYIAIVFMLPFFLVAYLSKKITANNITIFDFITIFLATILYSLFISFAYFLSFFQELGRADYKW